MRDFGRFFSVAERPVDLSAQGRHGPPGPSAIPRPRPTSHVERRTGLAAILLLAACSRSPYDETVAALGEGDLRAAKAAAAEVGGPVGVFLRGNVAFGECVLAERQAESAAAEPFAFDVAIRFGEEAERLWREAAMSRDDWPAARRNVERAQIKLRELRRKKQEAQDRAKPEPKPRPEPRPEAGKEKETTEEGRDLDPMLRELPPEEVGRILERLAEKERDKRAMRKAERSKRPVPRDW